jgi:hypothetical protein
MGREYARAKQEFLGRPGSASTPAQYEAFIRRLGKKLGL